MSRKYKLARFSTINEQREVSIPSRAYKGEAGTYQVTINSYKTMFTLAMPNGKEIHEHIGEFWQREALYQQLENGKVFEFIKRVLDELEQAEAECGIVRATFVADEVIYTLKIHTKTGHIELEIPNDYRLFQVENLYTDNADLPFFMNKNLDNNIRKTLTTYGLKLPKAPNRGGWGIRKNINY